MAFERLHKDRVSDVKSLGAKFRLDMFEIAYESSVRGQFEDAHAANHRKSNGSRKSSTVDFVDQDFG
ncbi:hypothetical protein BH11PLA2_BH11PLA2_19340 [soil metagenome]